MNSPPEVCVHCCDAEPLHVANIICAQPLCMSEHSPSRQRPAALVIGPLFAVALNVTRWSTALASHAAAPVLPGVAYSGKPGMPVQQSFEMCDSAQHHSGEQ